jgi:hypothetical protein
MEDTGYQGQTRKGCTGSDLPDRPMPFSYRTDGTGNLAGSAAMA